MGTVLSKINRFDDKMDSDEMTSEEYDDLANLRGWFEALNWALIPDGMLLKEHDAAIAKQERERVLKRILSIVDDRVRLNDYAGYIELVETIKEENNGNLISLRNQQEQPATRECPR